MDHTSLDCDFLNIKNVSDNNLLNNIYIKKKNSNNQTTNHNKNINIKVIKSVYRESSKITSKNMTEHKIVILDYNDMQINSNYYLLNNFKIEPTLLYKLNISYKEIVKTLNQKSISTIVNGRYNMTYEDSINLDKITGLACIAMNESEENNKRLRMRNTILEIKCQNYHSVVEENIRLKSKLDKITIYLGLALGRSGNYKEDNIMHLINLCAALYARESEYNYIQMENDNLKYALNKQFMNIRKITLNNYDEILNKLDKINEELIIKDLKISHLMEDIDMYSVNEQNNRIIQLIPEQFTAFSNESANKNFDGSLDKFQSNSELHEGKLLIAEQINQLEESNNVNVQNYRLSDLIDIFLRSIFDKTERLERINERVTLSIEDKNQQLLKEIHDQREWQKHLENENEKLNSEIDEYKRLQIILMSKDNEYVDLKKDFSHIQCMYDDLRKEDANLKLMLNEYQRKLTEKEIKCVDSDHLIKTLKANIKQQANKIEQTNSMYIKEKENCRRIAREMERIIEEYTIQLHRKTDHIATLQDECRFLKDSIGSTEAEIEYLKQKIITLEYELHEKNKTIQNVSEKQIKQQYSSISSLKFNDLLQILRKLEQYMDKLLKDWCTSKKKIMDYENVLNIMQNFNTDIKYQTLQPDNYSFKEDILLKHQQEIECLKNYYNLNTANLTTTEIRLKNQIKNLEEELKVKSSHLIMTERTASLQQKEAVNTIQRLTYINTNQILKINIMKKKIDEANITHSSSKIEDLINRGKIQMHCLIDYLRKLKFENITTRRECEIQNERIKYLENHHRVCTNHDIKFK